jgi:hypothetical protein
MATVRPVDDAHTTYAVVRISVFVAVAGVTFAGIADWFGSPRVALANLAFVLGWTQLVGL